MAGRTLARRQLETAHPKLADVSPEVGVLDEDALADLLGTDLDGASVILTDLARATDPLLRFRARASAARLLLPSTRRHDSFHRRGSTRLVTVAGEGVDLDLDATLERIADRPHPSSDDLRWRTWRRTGQAFVLVVDASGSVSGSPLATAVVAAAAIAARMRDDDELAVVAFWSKAVVLRDVRDPKAPETVLDALFDLRGGDTTDLAGGLRAGLAQAARARCAHREMLVLTDGIADDGNDFVSVAASAGASGVRIHGLCLGGARAGIAACERIADAGGGRFAALTGPADAPRAIGAVLAG